MGSEQRLQVALHLFTTGSTFFPFWFLQIISYNLSHLFMTQFTNNSLIKKCNDWLDQSSLAKSFWVLIPALWSLDVL